MYIRINSAIPQTIHFFITHHLSSINPATVAYIIIDHRIKKQFNCYLIPTCNSRFNQLQDIHIRMGQMKRKKEKNVLPHELISSLEKSDKKASTKRQKLFTTHTLPKSLATKAQFQIQNNLLECRILLQRALTYFSEEGNEEDRSYDESKVGKGLEELLGRLVNARNSLCSQTIQEDSQVESDDESDGSNDDILNQDQYQKHYNKLQSHWKTVLNRHYDNMNITKQYNRKDSNSKFFQVIDQSFWSQIENTVEHNMLHEQHSQINTGTEKNEDGVSVSIPKFDDTKIYQNMLQEYIALSANQNANNATTLAEQRLKLASKANNKKSKDDIDLRASKGRKIRYVVHEKIKNFTFPLQRSVNNGQVNNSIMDEDVLFKSMLGGVFKAKKK